MRVVLHCEGPGERGEWRFLPQPGDPLREDHLGPAHILIRRCLALRGGIPAAAVRFDSPLRTSKGVVPAASQLLDRAIARQLCTYLRPTMRPDLIVFLVDGDGDGAARRRSLRDAVEGRSLSTAVGVAEQEFEPG